MMMKRNLLTVLALASATLLSADTLVLKNGAKIEGALMGATMREVQFRGPDGSTKPYAISSIAAVQFGGAPAATTAAPRAAAAPPPAVSSIPAGTRITVRMIDRIDTKTTAIGERFRASIDDPIVVGNQVAIPRSADATVQVMQVEGKTELAIKLYDITLNGRSYDAVTNYAHLEAAGSSRGAKAARRGAVLGAIGAGIGAIAGGRRGAAIGAASGAGLGALSGAAARGRHLVIPPETRLIFELRAPLPLR